MPDLPSPPPNAAPTRAERERVDRLAREAQALRDNLRRRKQQSRARQEASHPGETAPAKRPDTPDDC